MPRIEIPGSAGSGSADTRVTDAGSQTSDYAWAVEQDQEMLTITLGANLALSVTGAGAGNHYTIAATASGADRVLTLPGGGTVTVTSGTTKTIAGYSPDGSTLRFFEVGTVAADPELWTPADHGLKVATFDPSDATANSVGQGLSVTRVRLKRAYTFTNWHTYVITAGATFAGTNAGYVFAEDGTLIASTADIATDLGSTGLKTKTLTPASGQSLSRAAGEWLQLGILLNATTRPQIPRKAGNNAAANGLGGSGATSRAGFNSGTSAPTSLPAITVDVSLIWLGLS